MSVSGVKRPLSSMLTAEEAENEIAKQRRKRAEQWEKEAREQQEEDERVVDEFIKTVVAPKQQEAITNEQRKFTVERVNRIGPRRKIILKKLLEEKNYYMITSEVHNQFVFRPLQPALCGVYCQCAKCVL